MGAGAEIVAGAIGGLFDGVKSIYDIYTNERDYDYQKALQQVIFNREDTAVQRRKADLIAAGMNPNLAAGSGANAGAVVGRSNTPSISGNPIGTALDTATAVSQLRSIREQNQILNNQKRESKAKADMAENQALLDNANLYQLLGLNMDLDFNQKNGKLSISPRVDFDFFNKDNPWSIYTSLDKNGGYGYTRNMFDTPLQDIFNYQYQNDRNSADLLQRDVDFYTADKIAQYFGAGVGAFRNLGAGYSYFRRR